MKSEIKGLVLRFVIYSVGDIILKALNFLLLPVYTRLLTPADYGILGVTNFLSILLSIFISLSLHGFLTPLYFSVKSDQERRERLGSLFVFAILMGGIIALLVDILGRFVSPFVIRDVPFDPYLRLTIWTTYFSTWTRIPLLLLRIQERSVTYVLITLLSSLLQIGVAIWFVVYLRLGIDGLLIAYCLVAIVMALISLILALRSMKLSLSIMTWREALIFSIPIIPHELSGWILELSDRAILQWYVSLDQVGIYSIAYSYGMLINLIAYAMNMAWVPYLHKKDAIEGEKAAGLFTKIGTYFALLLCILGLFFGFAAKPVITLMTAPIYHKSTEIAQWIVAALLLSSLYYFPINFLFLRRKTAKVSQITLTSSIVNVVLNLWLIPVYGAIAAAWTTFISYGVMLVLSWRASLQIYPISYQYKRLFILFLATVSLWSIGNSFPWTNLWVEIIGKFALLIAFPITLIISGFFTETEKMHLKVLLRLG